MAHTPLAMESETDRLRVTITEQAAKIRALVDALGYARRESAERAVAMERQHTALVKDVQKLQGEMAALKRGAHY